MALSKQLPNQIARGAAVVTFVGEAEVAGILRESDPFGIENRCPHNLSGHVPIASCGEVVCGHCGAIFWR